MVNPIHDENVLHVLRQLTKANGKAVHAAGAGYKTLYGHYTMPLPEYLVHEGWASEVWNRSGELQGLRITDEGAAWLSELERQYREYLARK